METVCVCVCVCVCVRPSVRPFGIETYPLTHALVNKNNWQNVEVSTEIHSDAVKRTGISEGLIYLHFRILASNLIT